MRLQSKFALAIFGLGLVVLAGATAWTYWTTRAQAIQSHLQALQREARDHSRQLDWLIGQEVRTLRTLARDPAIREALGASNERWQALPTQVRQARIQQLDDRWRAAPKGARPPVVARRLDNPAADRLNAHLADHPEQYGEIFVTDRFGVTVAASGRLTDLYQADEYHWQAAYHGGAGRIFLDDRGYDNSARARVLGLAVPLRQDGRVVGLLKANLRLVGGFAKILSGIEGPRRGAELAIVRANGQRVLGPAGRPRQGAVAPPVKGLLGPGNAGAQRVALDGEAALVAFSPIGSTLGRTAFEFGGRKASEEATGGSRGEVWLLLVRTPLQGLLAPLRQEALGHLAVGGLVVLALALLAAWLGRLMTRPVARLSQALARVGQGDLGVRVPTARGDELGQLATAFNAMVADLRRMQASRDEERQLRREYELSDAVLNAVGALVLILDPQGRIVRANPAFVQVTGFTEGEVQGRTPGETFVPAAEAEAGRAVFADLRAGSFPNQFEHPIATRAGGVRRVAWSNTAVTGPGGEVAWVVATGLDITDRHLREEELRLLAATFETSQAILIADPQGRIERVNQAFTQITGYQPEEVIGRNPRLLQSGVHGPAFYRAMWQRLQSQGYWEGEVWNRRKSGEIYPEWESISLVRDDQGAAEHYVAAFHDISERKRLEAELERLATYDGLTGAFNRNRFEGLLDDELERAERYAAPLSLVMFDLDHFKRVNDRHGHEVGDRVLQAVAAAVRQELRAPDRIGRWGGEEFLVMLPETGLPDAGRLAERLRARVEGAHPEAGDVSISLGVAAYGPGESRKAFLKRLDDALYRAKAGGRNRVEVAGQARAEDPEQAPE